MIIKEHASIEAEPLTVDKQLNDSPVRNVSQFFLDKGSSVENAVEQSGWSCFRIALFESTASAKVAVANSIHSLLAVHSL